MKLIAKKISLLILPFIFITQSCGMYNFTGGSIPAEMKTVSILFFENNAPLVVPYLSQQFTEALKDRIRNQTRLSTVRAEGDGNFEGRITDYSIRPTAIEGTTGTQTPRAGLNRLTITVSVKYTNRLNEEHSFEQSFSRYIDFNLNAGSIQSQEPQLISEVNKMLTEDIFNRAFANW